MAEMDRELWGVCDPEGCPLSPNASRVLGLLWTWIDPDTAKKYRQSRGHPHRRAPRVSSIVLGTIAAILKLEFDTVQRLVKDLKKAHYIREDEHDSKILALLDQPHRDVSLAARVPSARVNNQSTEVRHFLPEISRTAIRDRTDSDARDLGQPSEIARTATHAISSSHLYRKLTKTRSFSPLTPQGGDEDKNVRVDVREPRDRAQQVISNWTPTSSELAQIRDALVRGRTALGMPGPCPPFDGRALRSLAGLARRSSTRDVFAELPTVLDRLATHLLARQRQGRDERHLFNLATAIRQFEHWRAAAHLDAPSAPRPAPALRMLLAPTWKPV